MRLARRCAFSLLLLCVAPAVADVPSWQEETARDILAAKLPATIIAVTRSDGSTWVHGFGDRGDGLPPDGQTLFAVGSLTKSATSVAVMQLVEQGRLALDQPVASYLPELSNGEARAITVRQLMQQTSGISPISGFDTSPDASARLQRLSSTQLLAAPGSKFAYSNANYDLLGILLERVTKRSWADAVTDAVFRRLDARRVYGSLEDGRANGLVDGHQDWLGVSVRRPASAPPTAAGGLIACADDWATYVRAHLTHDPRLLSESSWAVLQAPSNASGRIYAMGWSVREVDGQHVWLHNGSTSNFSSTALFSPDGAVAVVVFTSAAAVPWPFLEQPTRRLALNALRRLAGRAPIGRSFIAAYGERLVKWLVVFGLLLGIRGAARKIRTTKSSEVQPVRESVSAGIGFASAAVMMLVVPRAVGMPLAALFDYAPDLAVILCAGALLALVQAAMSLAMLRRTGCRITR